MRPVLTVTLNPAIDQTVDVPRLHMGSVNRASAVNYNAGGKGVNVASCLADWGQDVIAAGLLGSDNKKLFEALFHQKQLRDEFVRIPGSTRINIKLLCHSSSVTTDVNLPGFPGDDLDFQRLQQALPPLFSQVNWAVLAGSLPEGLPERAWLPLLRQAREAQCRVVLDTSDAPLEAVLQAPATLMPYAIKPNRQELQQWAGAPLNNTADILASAQALLKRGLTLVVISMGEAGALFVSGTAALIARPVQVQVGSSVGAGDAMVAGMVSALVEGLPLPELARRATAFACAKLACLGPNLSSKADVLAFEERAQIELL